MTMFLGRKVASGKLLRLYALSLVAAVMVVSVAADSVLALRAPYQVPGSDIPYYYVSDGIGDNGEFPFTYVGFYWNSDSGSRTIYYNPRKCNDGGYDDSKDGDPRVTIYGINEDGTMNASNILRGTTHINACHNSNNNSDKYIPFTFDLKDTLEDKKIGMRGVVVRVDSEGDNNSRAWFSLETPDIDGAAFGVMGGRSVGYSRDFDKDSGGGYYDLQTGFGSCDAAPLDDQVVKFFDTDDAKYQSVHSLRIQFTDRSTGQAIDNDSTRIHDFTRISRRVGTPDTLFNINADSAEVASLQFDLEAKKGYRLDIQWLREGNDITVIVPTNEIYGKKTCPLPPPVWAMSGYTNVRNISTSGDSDVNQPGATAKPGELVKFYHHVVNNGPDTTNQDIWTDTQVSGGLGVVKAGHRSDPYTAGENKVTDTDVITIPSSAPAGRQYCQYVRYGGTTSTNPALSSGAQVCVTVQYDYELTPVVSAPSVIVSGEPVTFASGVNKDNTFVSNATDWIVRRIIIPAGATLNTTARVATNPASFTCSYYTSVGGGVTCTEPAGRSGTTTFVSQGLTSVGSDAESAAVTAGLAAGSRICYALAINSYNQAGKPNYRETVYCAVVAKYPALQVQNGNVRVGGVFGNATCVLTRDATNANNDPYGIAVHNYNSALKGSYGTQAAFALGRISYFGSTAPYSGAGFGTGNRQLLFGTGLSYGETGSGQFYGATQLRQNDPTFCLPNTATLYNTANLQASASAVAINGNGAVQPFGTASKNGSFVYRFAGSNQTLTIDAGTLGGAANPGQRTLVYISQNAASTGNRILINGPILYDNTGYTAAAELPQFILIADGTIDIQVASSVTEINGVYVTGGNIFTCDTFNGVIQMTNATCNLPLTVNGALIAAGRVLPYRTFGFENVADSQPAELFNLSPSTLLGDYERARGSGAGSVITTDKLSELPTRL